MEIKITTTANELPMEDVAAILKEFQGLCEPWNAGTAHYTTMKTTTSSSSLPPKRWRRPSWIRKASRITVCPKVHS